MPEALSIFEIIKRGGFEASLITTFNAVLPFYEEVVLRKLVGAGCRHNVVLMDDTQCAIAWTAESTRPRLAGHTYTLVPMKVPGAFHPKVCVLVGPRKASVLVGSHNLTVSGFGYNREITNWVEVSGDDAEGAAVLARVWQSISTWLEGERGRLPDSLIEAGLSLGNFVGSLAKPGEMGETVYLDQHPGSRSLLEQLTELIPPEIRRIVVVGAFFDAELAFIRAVEATWPTAKIVVGIDPDTVHLARLPKHSSTRFVNATLLGAEGSRGYLHAKALFFDGDGGRAAFVSGSANPSRPAWLGGAESANVEAIVVRLGRFANDAVAATGLSRLFDGPTLDRPVLEEAVARCAASPNSDSGDARPLLLAISDRESRSIRIDVSSIVAPTAAEILGVEDALIESTALESELPGAVVVTPSCDLVLIRSIRLLRGADVIARAMVHHRDVIANFARSTRQHQIRTALATLGSSEANISQVMAAVEKVIFSEEVPRQTATGVRSSGNKTPASTERPESLSVHVADLPKQRKKLRLLNSGDLAYLLDVLIRRLGIGLEQESLQTDGLGRTEEEQVNADDDISAKTGAKPGAPVLNDVAVAAAVARKAKRLVSRMLAQLERAAKNESLTSAAIVQLVAVLALLRELRHLDRHPRWKRIGNSLVAYQDRRHLLDGSVEFLFGSNTMLLQRLERSVEVPLEEAGQLRSLLLWLAWDVGEELPDQFSRFLEQDEIDQRTQAKGLFLELLPQIVSAPDEQSELERSIGHTVRQTPRDGERAFDWLQEHTQFGEAWALARSVPLSRLKHRKQIQVGDVAYAANLKEPHLRVVAEVTDQHVGLWEFDRIRRFSRNRVVSVLAEIAK